MNTSISRFLMITNGYEENRPALQYGVWLAQLLQANVDLLGIAESPDRLGSVERQVDETATRLMEAGVNFTARIVKGKVENVLQEPIQQQEHDMLVLGQLGRPPLRRLVTGRSFRHILAEISLPILYVPAVRWPIRRALVCIGGLSYALTVENRGLIIANAAKAALTLLHVVPPIDLDYPIAREIKDNWNHLAETNTLPGKTLRQAVSLATDLGLKVELKVLHGHIVEEILKEIKSQDYDLVCLGSPYSAHGLRYLYAPNVTAEVAEHAKVPILTARFTGPTDPA
ncbi:MAG: universal stress protein [Chloroflexota bacterium]